MSTWVLLRGLMREQRHWGRFPDQLRQALPAALVVTPDLPGNGTLHAEASPTHVAEMVECCRRDLAARGLRGPYRLLALSLGGMVAVEWCARYPDEIAAAVLINTSMRPFSRFYERLRWQNYPAVLAQLLRGGTERQEQLILRLTSRRPVDAALLAQWVAYQRQYPVRRGNALRQLWSAARYRAPAARPALPLLVLASGADRLVDPACSLRLAGAWQASYQWHPDAGHDLPLDDGPWLADTVSKWHQALSFNQADASRIMAARLNGGAP